MQLYFVSHQNDYGDDFSWFVRANSSQEALLLWSQDMTDMWDDIPLFRIAELHESIDARVFPVPSVDGFAEVVAWDHKNALKVHFDWP